MPHRRYSDPHIRKHMATDFVRRSYGISMIWVVIAFIVGFAFVIGTMQYLSYNGMLAYNPQESVITLTIIAGLILALLATMTVVVVNQNRDLIMASEFQNLLFSSSARVDTEFCLIIKKGGIIVYADPGFNEYFPYEHMGTDANELERLFHSGGLSQEDQDKVTECIKEGHPATLPFSIPGSAELLSLHVRPIERPTDYIVVRGVRGQTKATLFDTLNMGVFSHGENNKITYFNNAFADLLGYKEEKRQFLYHKSLSDLTTHDIPKNIKEITGNITLETINEEHKTVVISDIGHGYFLVTDATQAHQTIDTFTGDFWDFIENSPVPKLMLDERGSITKVNRAFSRLLNNHAKPIQENTAFINIIHPNYQEEVSKHLQNIIGQNSREEFMLHPIEIELKGEHDITALIYLSRILNPDKKFLGIVVHLIDTTEQKKLEQRFVHSQKMQAVGQLAGGIAHDFNNLLTAMMGFCDLLLMRHPTGDPSFADIMQIKQNLNRATNLVRQLLAFSRRQTLQPKVIDITSVMEELLQLIRRLIGENITLEMHHQRNINLIKVDQGQLEQVIINLAVNARDAMEGGGDLTIATKNILIASPSDVGKFFEPAVEGDIIENGEYVRIDVTDTGSGIAPDIMHKIFEPFFSTKEITSGTGLGLSTVYGIVRQTGGFIYVKTKSKKGTTFSIFFKSHTASEQEDTIAPPPQDDMPEQVTFKDLTGDGTVLLVEDEDPVRLFSSHALTNKGYHVLEADCGEAALQIVEKEGNNIDIIITDVVMPGINGPTMVETIQKTYPNIKVIYISGYAEDAFVKSYGTERQFHFLPKPFSLKQLASKVKEVLNETS